MIAAQPGMPVVESCSHGVNGLLRGVAGIGLRDAPPLASEPLSPSEWGVLMAGVHRHGLIGLLNEALHTGALPADDRQFASVEERLHIVMGHCLRLEALLLRVASVLTSQGIPFRVLKGVATAHLDYQDPALRPFVDVDLLVPVGAIPGVANALEEIDLVRDCPPLSRAYERRYAKTTTLDDPRGLQLDVHQRLALGPVGLAIPEYDLWSGSEELSLGGHTLSALDRERRVLHAAINVAIADWPQRLMAHRELAEMLLVGRPDFEAVRMLAHRWHVTPLLLQAIGDTWRALGLADSEPAWLAGSVGSPLSSAVAGPSSQRLLDLYRVEHRASARLVMAGTWALPAWERPMYLRAVLLPDRRHVRNGLRKAWARTRPRIRQATAPRSDRS